MITDKLLMNEMLGYLKPAPIHEVFRESTYSFGKRRHMEKIVSGELTHHSVWEEEVYKGPMSPHGLAIWLLQFSPEYNEHTWGVVIGYDGELYVHREHKVPYTEEELQEAKDYVATHEASVDTYIKFAAPVYDRDATLNLPRDEDGE